MTAIRALLRYALWPALVGAGMYTVYVWNQIGTELEYVVIWVFVASLAVLAVGERLVPYREDWAWGDGEVLPNLLHTAISTFAALFFTAVALTMTLLPLTRRFHAAIGFTPWPRAWPPLAQIVLMVAVWDFFGYWTHRWSHEWHWLWRVHALHHSPDRVHAVNAGRVHILDTLKTELVSLPILLLLGVPLGILAWYLAFFRIIGVLSHANVDLRLGPLNYLFNTPEVHRWHHSAVPAEGRSNYGQNFMVWDHLFRTYHKPAGEEVRQAGSDSPLSRGFFGQLLSPFTLGPPAVADAGAPAQVHSLVFACGCGERIRMKPAHVGRVWRCRACGTRSVVGPANTAPLPASAT